MGTSCQGLCFLKRRNKENSLECKKNRNHEKAKEARCLQPSARGKLPMTRAELMRVSEVTVISTTRELGGRNGREKRLLREG